MLGSPDYPVVAPTPTPFRADDSIDFDALQRNVDRWLATPLAEAKSIQDRLHEPDWQILSRRAAGLKAALNLLGFEAGVPRMPSSPCSADDIAAIKISMVSAGLLNQEQ